MPSSSLRRLALFLPVFLSGCSVAPHAPNLLPAMQHGSVHGGQQPVSNSSVELYAVGTTGDGSPATPLLSTPAITDANGTFSITGTYACPAPSALVYIVATGGNPGLPAGTNNPALAMMAALGPCGALSPSTFIQINELTTVAAVYALAPFLSSPSAVGSASADASSLATAFTLSAQLANVATGTTPGTGIPAGTSVPTVQINTIADILATCINTAGGVSGDSSPCGTFFSLTTPASTPAAADTITALLHLANSPTLNTAALYNLIPATAPFQPTQPRVPFDLAVRLTVPSAFTVSPATVNYPAATVFFSQPVQTVTVTNASTAPVNITSRTITGPNAADFTLVPSVDTDCAITVPVGSTCTFQIAFTPSATGERDAYLVLNNTSPNPVLAVALIGQGSAASAGPVTISPASLAFTLLGTPQNVTLTNSGSTPLAINSVFANSGYIQTNDCGTSLSAQSACTIAVSVPQQPSSNAGTLTIVDDAASGPQSVSLTFTGPGGGFPPTVDFGGWSLGAIGIQSFELLGSGISGHFDFTITGDNAADFNFGTPSAQTSSCNYEYRNGVHCYVLPRFTPSALGTRTAFLNIAGVGRLTLIGIGQPAGVNFGFFELPNSSPSKHSYSAPLASLTFGTSTIGSQVLNQLGFNITNTGTVSSISLASPVISGPNAADFTATNNGCSAPLTQYCFWNVTFSPHGTGARSATLTFTDTGNTVQRTLTLSGRGTASAPTFSVQNLYFSNVPLNTVSPAQTVTVTAYNNDPITATIGAPFLFTQGNFCPQTPCQLSVAYAPTSTAGVNGFLVATDTLGLTTGTMQTYGQVAPLSLISLSAAALNFGSQALGTSSTPQAVTVTNVGSVPLVITGVIQSAAGTTSPDFGLTSQCAPQVPSLVPGAACTFTVVFDPTSGIGGVGANLIISGSGTDRYVQLSGTAF